MKLVLATAAVGVALYIVYRRRRVSAEEGEPQWLRDPDTPPSSPQSGSSLPSRRSYSPLVFRSNSNQPVVADEMVIDTPVARKHLHTVKHTLSKNTDALQLWVADMELESPPHVVDAIVQRASEPTFGYTIQPSLIWTRVASWLVAHQNWAHAPSPDAFIFSANVVVSFCNALRALTREGDAVVVMVPSYQPLQQCVSGSGRRLVLHPLTRAADGTFEMNLPALAATLRHEGATALLLLSPHNPGGRVWRTDELMALADACAENDVLVVSDEIWADWVLPGPSGLAGKDGFVPFSRVANRCRHITLNAPTKTFNLAGLHASFLVIEQPALRRAYLAYVEPATMHFGSAFATTALLAAYDDQPSRAWLRAATAHVRANATWLTAELNARLPGLVSALPLQATYLIWLDFAGLVAALELTRDGGDDLEEFVLREAGLCLSPGSEFDPTGASDACMRLNAACPRGMIEEAAQRLCDAVEARRSARQASSRTST